jgi:hypothetical protein
MNELIETVLNPIFSAGILPIPRVIQAPGLRAGDKLHVHWLSGISGHCLAWPRVDNSRADTPPACHHRGTLLVTYSRVVGWDVVEGVM